MKRRQMTSVDSTWLLLTWLIVAGLTLPAEAEESPFDLPATGAMTSEPSVRNSPPQTEEEALVDYQEPAYPEPLNLKSLVLRLVLGTVGVLTACVASLWLAKRWLQSSPTLKPGDSQMRLMETLSLANRCHVQLIQVDGRKLLVGLDASGLKTILPLTEPFAETLNGVQEPETQSSFRSSADREFPAQNRIDQQHQEVL